MLNIDGSKCNGCGNCVEVCRQKAISISNNLAEINQRLCIQCGACLEACPTDAIKERVPAYTFSWKGGGTMMYGYGRGIGRGSGRGMGGRGGAGFGFRGASPPPPYYGRGRGGLPRCWYPGAAVASPYEPDISYYPSGNTREDELSWLKSQAAAIKAELGRIETRMSDLETSE